MGEGKGHDCQKLTFDLSSGPAGIQDEGQKISQYSQLLCRLPPVHKATLQALIHHLYWSAAQLHPLSHSVSYCVFVCVNLCVCVCVSVQYFSERNQMQSHALAIVFGPTLFQTDGQDYSAGRAIEDLIEHYKLIFQVWANLGTHHYN